MSPRVSPRDRNALTRENVEKKFCGGTHLGTLPGTLEAHIAAMRNPHGDRHGTRDHRDHGRNRTWRPSAAPGSSGPPEAAANRSHDDLTGVVGGDRLALTVTEAAALLGISRALAYELVARGELPSIRLGRRLVVPKVALLEMLGVHPRREA